MSNLLSTLFTAVVFSLLIVACAGGGNSSLTEGQLQKLDPALRNVVQGETPEQTLSSTTRSDGTVAYAVFIRTTDVERVREAGIPINSTSGNILTARLSKSEIRKAAQLDAVTSIESSGEAEPHAQ